MPRSPFKTNDLFIIYLSFMQVCVIVDTVCVVLTEADFLRKKVSWDPPVSHSLSVSLSLSGGSK